VTSYEQTESTRTVLYLCAEHIRRANCAHNLCPRFSARYRYFCCCFTDESILLDLKHLLIEAKQKVPEFLANLQSENEQYLNIGGMYRSKHPFHLLYIGDNLAYERDFITVANLRVTQGTL